MSSVYWCKEGEYIVQSKDQDRAAKVIFTDEGVHAELLDSNINHLFARESKEDESESSASA